VRFGSLFSGIGGFDLGLERAGMECAWQVEIDEFCRKVLAKHWPDVPKYGDVRDVGAHNLEPVDLICGGFPCQPVSSSGKRLAQDDERWLWPEFARVVRELRPDIIVLENVADLLHRGFGDVLGDLATLGYDAEWDVLPACALGSPQRRERVFVVAYADGGRLKVGPQCNGARPFLGGRPDGDGLVQAQHRAQEATSRIRGMDDGLPGTVDRLRALGNAVVPQVAEWIGQRIMDTPPRDTG
jgi:DNA (cytosine-5)-methyltransferase 1